MASVKYAPSVIHSSAFPACLCVHASYDPQITPEGFQGSTRVESKRYVKQVPSDALWVAHSASSRGLSELVIAEIGMAEIICSGA